MGSTGSQQRHPFALIFPVQHPLPELRTGPITRQQLDPELRTGPITRQHLDPELRTGPITRQHLDPELRSG